jgi:hypothetical protein
MLKRPTFRVLVALLLFSLNVPAILAQCGVERWSVKTGTDADVSKVNLGSSSSTTVATMRGWTKPASIPANNRISPYETTQWVINGTLTQYKSESDSDYHLVIADASGNTVIVEIPSPNCVGAGSPFGPAIASSRNKFDAQLTATGSFKTANIPVQIKGVGMFDFLHGQTGVAPNGIEIHPVLDIIFNPSTSADFSIGTSPTSVTAVQGTSANTTVSTSLSGSFNSSVSLSASGLPAGATATFSPSSIAAPGSGSSTLTLTAGASTATGAYTVTVTGTGGGKTHTSTVTFNVTSSGGGGSQQLLGNPGFETGAASPWTATTGTISNSTSEPPHGGSWDAWLDGYGTTTTDTLGQTVTIPSTATSASLSFWLHVDTAETTTATAYDTLKVQIRNTSGTVLATLATYSNLNHNTGYAQKSFSLLSYKGQTVQVYLVGAEDSTLQTSFVVDDFALNVQ